MVQKQISRRDFLKSAALAASGVAVMPRVNILHRLGTAAVPAGFRVTGDEVPGLETFDSCMYNYMSVRNIPCGSVAVARKGKLVFARGYTFNHPELPETQPTSLFRVASVSKPFTGVAILQLAQAGKLDLNAKVVDLINLNPFPGYTPDPRLGNVTVLDLLHHQGGWDRGLVPDPMFMDLEIAKILKSFKIKTNNDGNLPISQADIINYVTGQPLQHDPGAVYAYSNYGYMLLGRIIEKITKVSYAEYVAQNIFAPLGITRMRQGRSLLQYRDPNEVAYFSTWKSMPVFPGLHGLTPNPDGTFNLENMDSHGAWISSPVDLVRFASAFGSWNLGSLQDNALLNAATEQTLLARPENGWAGSLYWYGCGWLVRDKSAVGIPGAQNVWHDGSLPGTVSYLVRRYDGYDWAVTFNQRDDPNDRYSNNYWVIDTDLHTAANTADWSLVPEDYDQFSKYF